MARADPLEGRGVPRHGGLRRRRRGDRPRAALLALSALVWPAPPAQERIDAAWGREYAEIQRDLASEDVETRWAAVDRLHALHAEVSAGLREAALLLYHCASELGREPEFTPELEARLTLLAEASRAALLYGSEDAAAEAQDRRARELGSAGRRREAHAVLARAFEAYPEAREARPILALGLAELDRRLGSFGSALTRLAELEVELAGRPDAEGLWPVLAALRARTQLDAGLPDRAAPEIRARWSAAEELLAEGETLAGERFAALVAVTNLDKALGRHAQAAARIERLLDATEGEQRAHLECLLGTSELELEEGEPERERRGAARVRGALQSGLDDSLALYARVALADDALARGAAEEAAAELAAARQRTDPESGEDADLLVLEARLALQSAAPRAELAEHRRRLDEALAGMAEAWSALPDEEGGIGFLLYGRRRALLGELVRLTLELEPGEAGVAAAFAELVRVQALGSLARRAELGAPSLEFLQQRWLGPRHGLLVYLPAPGASHLFLLDRERLSHVPLVSSARIDPLRRGYFSHLLGAPRGELDPETRAWLVAEERRLAGELSLLVLPPAAAERVRGWSALSIVGVDALGPLPFEWLPLGAERHLGLQRAVDYVPGLPLVPALLARAGARPALDLELVVAVEPAPGAARRWPELAAIPWDEARSAELAAAYPAERVHAWPAASATPEALAAHDFSSAGVLQIVAHGALDERRARPAVLMLSAGDEGEGLFGCEHAQRARPPALVVLTACRSAGGPLRRGDAGAADFGGAWLSAGARAVVLSHAELLAEDALLQSEALHARLAAGGSPAAALASARAELVRTHGELAPFLGGLLHVVGLGHEPVFPAGEPGSAGPGRGPPLAWLAGGALLGLAAGYAARRAPLRAGAPAA
jgi:hypothetical protein